MHPSVILAALVAGFASFPQSPSSLLKLILYFFVAQCDLFLGSF